MRTLTHSILAVSLALGLAGCNMLNPSGAALDQFKASQIGSELATCAGPRGSVDWSIADLQGSSDSDVKRVTVVVNKNGQSMRLGYDLNIKTKVHELAAFGEPGDSTPGFLVPLRIATFCG